MPPYGRRTYTGSPGQGTVRGVLNASHRVSGAHLGLDNGGGNSNGTQARLWLTNDWPPWWSKNDMCPTQGTNWSFRYLDHQALSRLMGLLVLLRFGIGTLGRADLLDDPKRVTLLTQEPQLTSLIIQKALRHWPGGPNWPHWWSKKRCVTNGERGGHSGPRGGS